MTEDEYECSLNFKCSCFTHKHGENSLTDVSLDFVSVLFLHTYTVKWFTLCCKHFVQFVNFVYMIMIVFETLTYLQYSPDSFYLSFTFKESTG